MPTYEYKCKKCKKVFEIFQQMSEKPLTVCPDKKCKGRVKRLIGAGAGFIFKGQGFYATDYRSKGYKEKQKAENPAPEACKACDKKKDCPNVDK